MSRVKSSDADTPTSLFEADDAQQPVLTPGQTHAVGVLPAHGIENMIREKQIWASGGVNDDQVQPASLDLRLGDTAYRIRASFLPGEKGQVMDKLSRLAYHKIDLSQGAVLESKHKNPETPGLHGAQSHFAPYGIVAPPPNLPKH